MQIEIDPRIPQDKLIHAVAAGCAFIIHITNVSDTIFITVQLVVIGPLSTIVTGITNTVVILVTLRGFRTVRQLSEMSGTRLGLVGVGTYIAYAIIVHIGLVIIGDSGQLSHASPIPSSSPSS